MGRIIYERSGVSHSQLVVHVIAIVFLYIDSYYAIHSTYFAWDSISCNIQSMYIHLYVPVLDAHVQEYFFVPYTFTDVNDEREIHKGDEVSFYMAKNKRSVHGDPYYCTCFAHNCGHHLMLYV